MIKLRATVAVTISSWTKLADAISRHSLMVDKEEQVLLVPP